MTMGQGLTNQNTAPIFKKFVYSVWGFIVFYAILYSYMGAYFSAAAVGTGVFILSPLTLLIKRQGYRRTARILFLFSCNFYVYATSLGFGHSINIEYYSICAPMVGLLVCDLDDRWTLGTAVVLPVITRVLTITLGASVIPEHWVHIPQEKSLFMALNFFGAFGLSILFISLFVKTIKEQRAQIVASAKMSSLGEMAGGVAHEINTPLATMSMRLEQLEESVKDNSMNQEDILGSIRILQLTTERIGKIVNGLRFFAREGSGDSMQAFVVQDVLEDTLSFCQERFRNHGVELTYTPKNENPIKIKCRSVEISQVFLNLLNNSFDAIQTFEKKWIHIDITEKQSHVEISFTDCGQGIPQELQEKILQPFFTTKGVGKGTGLGLSLSKGIIEAHSGRMYLDKKCPNTRFVIEMPQCQDEVALAVAS